MNEVSVRLGSDEHGFLVEGPAPARPDSLALPVNTLLDWWPDSEPDLDGFLVKTGSQWGPFAVVVRVVDAAPGPPDPQWEDVVEVTVDVRGGVMISEIVNGPEDDLACPDGTYRMRVAALGRTESAVRDGDPDSDDEEPLEHYLVELWPAPPEVPQVLREESRYAKNEKNPPPAPAPPAEEEVGLAAAWRLIRDLRGEPGARSLPGPLTTLSLSLELPGTKQRLFNRLRYASGWPPSNGGGGSPDPFAPQFYDATVPGDGSSRRVGEIALTTVEVDKPNRVVRRWNWVRGRDPYDGPRVLPDDSTVTLAFARINGEGEDARTLVRLIHEGIPTSWREDLAALWSWDLVRRSIWA